MLKFFRNKYIMYSNLDNNILQQKFSRQKIYVNGISWINSILTFKDEGSITLSSKHSLSQSLESNFDG